MIETSASEIRAGDIGARVVVIDTQGNAYDGTLTGLAATDWKYGKRDEERVRININITVSSEERSELKISALPLDFLLQIDREQNR